MVQNVNNWWMQVTGVLVFLFVFCTINLAVGLKFFKIQMGVGSLPRDSNDLTGMTVADLESRQASTARLFRPLTLLGDAESLLPAAARLSLGPLRSSFFSRWGSSDL